MKTFIYFSQGEWRTFQAEELPVKPEYRYVFEYWHLMSRYESEIAALKAKSLKVGNPETCPQNISAVEDGKIYEWPGTVEVKEILGPGWVPSYNDPDNSGGYPNAEPMEVVILKLPA